MSRYEDGKVGRDAAKTYEVTDIWFPRGLQRDRLIVCFLLSDSRKAPVFCVVKPQISSRCDVELVMNLRVSVLQSRQSKSQQLDNLLSLKHASVQTSLLNSCCLRI